MQRLADVRLNYRVQVSQSNLDEIDENIKAAIRISEAGGKTHEVTITPPRRSNPQNDKWHKLLRAIAQQTGHSVEEVKHAVKLEFLGEETFVFKGSEFVRPRSSSGLTENEMSQLITQTEALFYGL